MLVPYVGIVPWSAFAKRCGIFEELGKSFARCGLLIPMPRGFTTLFRVLRSRPSVMGVDFLTSIR